MQGQTASANSLIGFIDEGNWAPRAGPPNPTWSLGSADASWWIPPSLNPPLPSLLSLNPPSS